MWWRFLLLAALSGLVLADDSKDGGTGSPFGRLFGGDQLDPRLAANALLILRLERIIEKLKTKLHEAEKLDPEHFVNEIDARVTEIEGKSQNNCSLPLTLYIH